MAGTGPPRKHPSVRARTNKTSTRATLVETEDGELVEIPELPPRVIFVKDAEGIEQQVEVDWHPMTLAWWEDIWPSPMAKEWHSSDVHGLFAVALLYDDFFRRPDTKKHAELRQARMPYGLTPLDRRRLEWTIESSKTAQANGRTRDNKAVVAAAPTPTPGQDPRFSVA